MRYLVVILLLTSLLSCVRNKSGKTDLQTTQTQQNVFEVSEVIQTPSYTYMRVKENLGERWVAITKQDVNEGEVLYYDEALQMTNFESKELQRTFDVIYFVNEISRTPFETKKPDLEAMHSGKMEMGSAEVEMKKSDSELTLAELFAQKEKYANEQFEIRGTVVKVNNGIMGKNWIHIQDGTAHDGDFDLTLTTQDIVEINAEVTFRGKLSLNKDFGYGYSYEVIMEDAELMVRL